MRAEFTRLFPVVSATLNILGVHIYCFWNRGLSPRRGASGQLHLEQRSAVLFEGFCRKKTNKQKNTGAM